jgi:hypothetical protein
MEELLFSTGGLIQVSNDDVRKAIQIKYLKCSKKIAGLHAE